MKQINKDEQLERVQMIRDSAVSIGSKGNDLTRVRALRFSEQGADKAIWQKMCDMGWVGIRLPEAEGGIGLGMAEYIALLEELGKALVPEPLVDAVFVAGLLPQEIRQKLISGACLILPAGFDDPNVPAVHIVSGKLKGHAKHVYLANVADEYLVYTDQGMVLVDRAEVKLTTSKTQDGGHQGMIVFDHVASKTVMTTNTAQIIGLLDDAALGNAAYLLGVMQSAFDQTLSYLTVRKQFGKAIGSFQVLQHRAVDLKIQIELTRAIINQAANMIDEGRTAVFCQKAVSTAKIRASNAAFAVTRAAIQFHGGIGYTDEADIGLFLRKTMVLMNRYGSENAHRQRFIKLNDYAVNI